MGMDTVCRVLPETSQAPANRFMRRYTACRNALTSGKSETDRVLASSTATAEDGSGAPGNRSDAPGRADQSFLQLYLQAFAAARQ